MAESGYVSEDGGDDVLDGFQANPTSLTGTAAILHDLAQQLQAGQVDLFLLDWAAAPASHPDMARAMRSFAEFAHDQYQDVIALLAALSTRVESSSDGYQHTDAAIAAEMTRFLTESTFQPADQRPN
ncbi:hypothetical protein KIF24_13370 [Micromonospora sp. Llam7]|uniref:hypothetical protein n=1 Tax=Micromonospora tarapacensis TaxID=2835305 RepID=UPI001C83BC36|nr:hypothetical protein [Micromonospora tarapacensis]MBX7266920.1 hypothetical protein [Micromonospora tarapacensis]